MSAQNAPRASAAMVSLSLYAMLWAIASVYVVPFAFLGARANPGNPLALHVSLPDLTESPSVPVASLAEWCARRTTARAVLAGVIVAALCWAAGTDRRAIGIAVIHVVLWMSLLYFGFNVTGAITIMV
jgi:hypothetical protein